MAIEINPFKEQSSLVEAQEFLLVFKKYGNMSPTKMKKWAEEILHWYPNQNVIEEVWRNRILEADILHMQHKGESDGKSTNSIS